MTHGSLFSGIGGFDLAAEWMGWENKFHCEWNEFGKRVLKYYWPQANSHDDITKTDFTKYYGTIDIISGGFPCQPYSSAGKRLGKADDRHLWPHMLRAIKEVAPRWVVGENVRGLTNWNGGLVFDEVCADLENLGYQVAPYLIPACAVNAPHRRERIWFVAYRNASDTDCIRLQQCENTREVGIGQNEICGTRNQFTNAFETNGAIANASDTNCDGLNECNGKYEIDSSQRGINALNDLNANDERGNAADTDNERLERTRGTSTSWFNDRFANICEQNAMHTNGTSKPGKYIGQTWQGKFNGSNSRDGFNNFQNFPTQSPICGGDDGLPTELDGITFSKWRNESIKAYGNAVVPQVVYQIFKAIEQYETTQHNPATGHS